MESSCEFGHSPIIDSSTATVVCDRCCVVLDERLSYHEINHRHFLVAETTSLKFEDREEIHGEPVIEVLKKIGDKLHLCESSIDNAYKKYFIIKHVLRENSGISPISYYLFEHLSLP